MREDWQEILLARRREAETEEVPRTKGSADQRKTIGERETIATEDAVLTATPSRTKPRQSQQRKVGSQFDEIVQLM